MTIWKDGGMYGKIRREVVSEYGSYPVAIVRVRQYLPGSGTEPWPEGEENFRLVLNASRMLEALEMIWNTRQSASYEERTEAGVTGYSFYLTVSQYAKIRNVLAAVKRENDELA